jgi:hypothetical protein
MDDHIIPECYIDSTLTETLIPPKTKHNHQKGCPKVAEEMKIKFKDGFAIGILDKDKKAVAYQNEFKLLANKNNISLYKHPLRHHYLILHPPFEKWIISEAQQANLLLEDYHLPNDFKELMKITKRASSTKDYRFKQLFRALQENDAQGIVQLFEWMDYLIKHPYNADETFLIDIGNQS